MTPSVLTLLLECKRYKASVRCSYDTKCSDTVARGKRYKSSVRCGDDTLCSGTVARVQTVQSISSLRPWHQVFWHRCLSANGTKHQFAAAMTPSVLTLWLECKLYKASVRCGYDTKCSDTVAWVQTVQGISSLQLWHLSVLTLWLESKRYKASVRCGYDTKYSDTVARGKRYKSSVRCGYDTMCSDTVARVQTVQSISSLRLWHQMFCVAWVQTVQSIRSLQLWHQVFWHFG